MARLQAILCSGNPHKLAEFSALFPGWELELLEATSYPQENGATYLDNARDQGELRPRRRPRRTAGCSPTTPGSSSRRSAARPGSHTARWAEGRHVEQALDALRPAKDRRARYVCELVAALARRPRAARHAAMLEGTIADGAAGAEGFGFDPVFVPRGETQTVAQLGDAWKASTRTAPRRRRRYSTLG